VRIDSRKCIGCGNAGPAAPWQTLGRGTIRLFRAGQTGTRQVHYVIDEDECWSAASGLRTRVLPTEKRSPAELAWPRIVRKNFSDPLKIHPETPDPGRGTEEMRRMTSRAATGEGSTDGLRARPARHGARFYDVEKVAMALASLGLSFEENNPLTKLMVDRKKRDDHRRCETRKVLSAIVDGMVPQDMLSRVWEVSTGFRKRCDTVVFRRYHHRIGVTVPFPTSKTSGNTAAISPSTGRATSGLDGLSLQLNKGIGPMTHSLHAGAITRT